MSKDIAALPMSLIWKYQSKLAPVKKFKEDLNSEEKEKLKH